MTLGNLNIHLFALFYVEAELDLNMITSFIVDTETIEHVICDSQIWDLFLWSIFKLNSFLSAFFCSEISCKDFVQSFFVNRLICDSSWVGNNPLTGNLMNDQLKFSIRNHLSFNFLLTSRPEDGILNTKSAVTKISLKLFFVEFRLCHYLKNLLFLLFGTNCRSEFGVVG
jgi:hypothetical protein